MSHSRAAAAHGARRRASSGSTGSCLTTAPSAPAPGTPALPQTLTQWEMMLHHP